MDERVVVVVGSMLVVAVRRRLELLFDDGKFQTIELPATPGDPLKFRDRKRYGERLKEAQSKSKESEAIVVIIAKRRNSFMAALMSIPMQSWLMVLGRPCEM